MACNSIILIKETNRNIIWSYIFIQKSALNSCYAGASREGPNHKFLLYVAYQKGLLHTNLHCISARGCLKLWVTTYGFQLFRHARSIFWSYIIILGKIISTESDYSILVYVDSAFNWGSSLPFSCVSLLHSHPINALNLFVHPFL